MADVLMVMPRVALKKRGCPGYQFVFLIAEIYNLIVVLFFSLLVLSSFLVAGLALLYVSLVDNLVTICGCGHNLVFLFVTESGDKNMLVT